MFVFEYKIVYGGFFMKLDKRRPKHPMFVTTLTTAAILGAAATNVDAEEINTPVVDDNLQQVTPPAAELTQNEVTLTADEKVDDTKTNQVADDSVKQPDQTTQETPSSETTIKTDSSKTSDSSQSTQSSSESKAPKVENKGDEKQVTKTPTIKATPDQPSQQAKVMNPNSTVFSDSYLKDLGIDLNDDALKLATLFHIFAKEVNLGADTNGNIATALLNATVDFGTRHDSVNITAGDIDYIQQLTTNLKDCSFRNEKGNHVVLGEDVDYQENDGKVFINGVGMTHLKPGEVKKDADGKVYIDFDEVFKNLTSKSEEFYGKSETTGVIKDFSDMNNKVIDVSGVSDNEIIYVDVDFKDLNAAQPLNIKGLSKDPNGPMVVINVKGDSNSSGVKEIQTQVKLYYGDDKDSINASESHKYANHILWNFGKGADEYKVSCGYLMGSVLAPNSTFIADVNVDGNIIANKVMIEHGESHRWDLHYNVTKEGDDDAKDEGDKKEDEEPSGGESTPPSTDDKPGSDDKPSGDNNPGETPGNKDEQGSDSGDGNDKSDTSGGDEDDDDAGQDSSDNGNDQEAKDEEKIPDKTTDDTKSQQTKHQSVQATSNNPKQVGIQATSNQSGSNQGIHRQVQSQNQVGNNLPNTGEVKEAGIGRVFGILLGIATFLFVKKKNKRDDEDENE